MPTPFDATTKELVRFQPEDWLALLGLPPKPCELVDADLATVSTEADRLIAVQAEVPYQGPSESAPRFSGGDES